MSDMFNLDHLIQSERKTHDETRAKFGDIYSHFSVIINTLFKLLYSFGETEKVKSDLGYYQNICLVHYSQAPYTFWVLNNLTTKGYYLESTVLYRHLMEAFIQIIYYKRYPEKIQEQLQRKNFREMFDEFSPGYYKNHYSLLCDAAHGVVFKDWCRFDRRENPQGHIRMGCELHLTVADFLVGGIIVLLYGYLNKYVEAFPKNTIKNEPAIDKEYEESKSWLAKLMSDHKAEFPKSKEWYEHIEKFIM